MSQLLSFSNSKLGTRIGAWSIPSGDSDICVGATPACLAVCYAGKGHYRRHSVQGLYQRNLAISRSTNFSSLMIHAVRKAACYTVRVHASGEFYDSEYVQKWIQVMRTTSRVQYFAYTRSWNTNADSENYDADLLPSLVELSQLPNMRLWWSCDKDTGEPPHVDGVCRAYMSTGPEDVPDWPVDLMFRTVRKTVQKRLGGTLVCPAENGVTEMTCSQCKLCYTDNVVTLKRFAEVTV